MALQISYTDDFGAEHPEAYARIQRLIVVNPVKGGKTAMIEVCIYHKKAAKTSGKRAVWGPRAMLVERPVVGDPTVMECAINPDNAKVSDCYVWLKTQPGFTESLDV